VLVHLITLVVCTRTNPSVAGTVDSSTISVFIGHFDTAVTIQLDVITNVRDPVDVVVTFQGTGWGFSHTASVTIPVECGNYYYGANCEGFDCNGNPCENNGKCVAPDVCNCDNTGNAIFIS
jgi:hypothetical protein